MLATRSWRTGTAPHPPRALLVHGITSSAATMWELGEGLAAAGWEAVAVDLPGHGDSGPAGSYRFADVADTIAGELGPGFDLLVGHSLGGAIGTVLLARHPGVAARAVLLDPALRVPPAVAGRLAGQLVADKAQGPAEVRAAHPHWHPATVDARLAATAAADVDAVKGFADHNRPWDAAAAAREVTVPVRVLLATDGSAVAPDLVTSLPAANPHWTFETVPDSSHSLHRDHPALVLRRVLDPA